MPPKYPFKPLKKARLYEEVAEQIKQAIFDGQLKPGDRLPSERNLCQLFNVGRPTIREALRTLSVLGLIDINPGFKGSIIKDIDVTQYMEAIREQLSWMIKADESTLQEMWEVRKYIELGIAHSVAKNATQNDLKKIDKLLKRMENSYDDMETYFQLAVEFHRQLALASRNKIFFLIWEMFHDILLKGYIPILDELFPDGASKLLTANQAFLKAIKSKDTKAIDKAMELHAEDERVFRTYSEMKNSSENATSMGMS